MSTEADVNPKAYPLADGKLTKDILELVHQAQNYVSEQRIIQERDWEGFFSCSINYAKVLMKLPRLSIVVELN